MRYKVEFLFFNIFLILYVIAGRHGQGSSSLRYRISSKSSFLNLRLELITFPSGAVTLISMTVPSARECSQTAFVNSGNLGCRVLNEFHASFNWINAARFIIGFLSKCTVGLAFRIRKTRVWRNPNIEKKIRQSSQDRNI